MLIFRRKGKVVGGTHFVYTKKEAEEQGIDIIPDWRKAETGDWVMTNDGWVGQVLDVKYYRDARRTHSYGYEVYTAFMKFAFGRATNRMPDFELRKMLLCKGTLANKSRVDQFLSTFRGRLFVHYYCMMILSTGKIDYVELGRIVAPGKRAAFRARMYIKNLKVQDKIYKTMSQILKDKGIDHETVLNDLKKIKDEAIEKGKYKEALEVLSKFERWTGLEQLVGEEGSKKLPKSSKSSEDESLMERYHEIAGELEEANNEKAENNMNEEGDGDEIVKINNHFDKDGPVITDENGQPVFEVGRGDEQ